VAVFVTLELEKWLLRRWHGGAWASA
jgi:hypothetical protein